jgi:hypothetical protein
MQLTGTIGVVDPAGKLVVNTPQGAIQIWRATNGIPFSPGNNVRVQVRVQPMDVVLVQPGPAGVTASAPTPISPSASPRTEPGDYAIVMGRVVAVDPSLGGGEEQLTVELADARNEIARRAYELSLEPEAGTDEENWLRAERELGDE